MRVFSDRSLVSPGQGHVTMLYPFWGKNPEDPSDPVSGRFDRFAKLGRSFFQMAELAEADVAVYPRPWEHVFRDDQARSLAVRFADRALNAGKRVAVFFWSDSDKPVHLENAVIFRTSLYRSKRAPHVFAMPAWGENFVERYCDNQLPLRAKGSKPVVGFCGNADPINPSLAAHTKKLGCRLANALRVRQARFESRPLRTRALRALSESPFLETNFVVRPLFLGGAVQPDGTIDLAVKRQIRGEFVQNMVDSDYVLCTRGGGNFSYRLYETLSCGRIPVFIDTDCVLPYHSEIDWKRYSVWVDEAEVDSIAERVAEFHDSLVPDQFVELQKECRKLWEEWLSPVGFFSNLHRRFVGVVGA